MDLISEYTGGKNNKDDKSKNNKGDLVQVLNP